MLRSILGRCSKSDGRAVSTRAREDSFFARKPT